MTGFRTGLLGASINTGIAPELVLRSAQRTGVVAGVDSVWLSDHLIGVIPQAIWSPKYLGVARLAPRADAFYEPWTALGYLAARNRFTRTRLGIGVTDAGRRNPAVTAQAAATLHLLSRGRAILGIGPGERENNDPYGVDWSKPVGRFEEALEVIRLLWHSGGTPVTRESTFFPLRDAVFDLPPYKGTRPEIWIGGHGPRMLKATGRFADAWFPSFPQLPDEYGVHLETVRTAASDAGRDPDAVIPARAFFVATAKSRDIVEETLDSVVPRAFALNASAEVWRRHGAVHPLGANFSGIQDILPQSLDEHTVLDYAARVPASLLREILLTGTPSDIVDQIADWRDHGVRYAVLSDVSTLAPSLRKALNSTIPFVQVLRRIKRL